MELDLESKKVLTSTYQNISTALMSIEELLKKTEDKEFLSLLNAQYKRYDELSNKLTEYVKQYNYEVKDNSIFEKIKLWTSINMTTLTDNSTRHLAEMMLLGTVMGTLTCYKDKSDHSQASEESLSFLKQLEKLEEQNFDELKKYLNK